MISIYKCMHWQIVYIKGRNSIHFHNLQYSQVLTKCQVRNASKFIRLKFPVCLKHKNFKMNLENYIQFDCLLQALQSRRIQAQIAWYAGQTGPIHSQNFQHCTTFERREILKVPGVRQYTAFIESDRETSVSGYVWAQREPWECACTYSFLSLGICCRAPALIPTSGFALSSSVVILFGRSSLDIQRILFPERQLTKR